MFIQDSYIGWLPAALGVEEDRGATTRMSVGPGQMAEHPNESLLFVSNFNHNTESFRIIWMFNRKTE